MAKGIILKLDASACEALASEAYQAGMDYAITRHLYLSTWLYCDLVHKPEGGFDACDQREAHFEYVKQNMMDRTEQIMGELGEEPGDEPS